MNGHFKDMHEDKNTLDNELRFLYVQKLFSYYSALVMFHDRYFDYDGNQKGKSINYDLIYDNVNTVVKSFTELETFMITILHLDNNCFSNRPLEFHFLRNDINYWIEN